MSRKNGVLVVTLTNKWFDMIASGEKREEYRGNNWASKLLREYVQKQWPRKLWEYDLTDYEPYHTFRAQRGYSGVWLERKVKYIHWGAPNPAWCGSDLGNCFVIGLEEL
jgi:hypothetical protein